MTLKQDQSRIQRPQQSASLASASSRKTLISSRSSSLIKPSSSIIRPSSSLELRPLRLIRPPHVASGDADVANAFLKNPYALNRRDFLRGCGAFGVAVGTAAAVIGISPAEAMTGFHAMLMGHVCMQTVNAVVSASANNLDFRTLLVNSGWAGTCAINGTVTIDSGIYVGSSSTSTPAFTITGSFPSGSTLNLVNNGYISGAGGAGGAIKDAAGSAGGMAIMVSVPVNITNNGYIWGGGGGGGAGASSKYSSRSRSYACGWNKGGGGGGTVYGSGAHAGTATAGGAGSGTSPGAGGNPGKGGNGGSGTCVHTGANGTKGYGGGGGSPGYSGGQGGDVGGAGGLPGYYISGNSYVTWVATGTRLGRSS